MGERANIMTKLAPRRAAGILAAALLGSVSPAHAQMEPPPPLPNPFPALPAAPVNLAGVWKLAIPAVSLKPVSGVVPFTAEGRRQYEANKAFKAQKKFDEYDIATSRCSTPGVPRLMLTPMRFKIWHQLGVMTFGFEWNQAIRQIDLRGIKTQDKLVPDMAGTSVGRWEGDTLIAVTNDFTGRSLWDDLLPQSTDAKVTERFRLVDPDTLEDHLTIEDPVNFTRPWNAVLTFKRQPAVFFAEDVCLDRINANQPAFPRS